LLKQCAVKNPLDLRVRNSRLPLLDPSENRRSPLRSPNSRKARTRASGFVQISITLKTPANG